MLLLLNYPELAFDINLLFDEEDNNPKDAVQAFKQVLDVYEVLLDFDKLVVRNISPDIQTEYALFGVDYASIKTKLVQILKGIPDELLKDLKIHKIIGYFLVKLKYKLIKKLSEEKVIESKEQVQQLTQEVNAEINNIGEQYSILVTQVNNYFILNSLNDFAEIINKLRAKEKVEYKSLAGNVTIFRGIKVNMPKILSELGQREIVNETTELLKLKKVDMLSNESKWDFLQGKRLIKAKVMDKDWLDSFHRREVIIKPEDGLMVTLRTTHTYTPNFDDKHTECEIVKVHSVISPDNDSQQLELGKDF